MSSIIRQSIEVAKTLPRTYVPFRTVRLEQRSVQTENVGKECGSCRCVNTSGF